MKRRTDQVSPDEVLPSAFVVSVLIMVVILVIGWWVPAAWMETPYYTESGLYTGDAIHSMETPALWYDVQTIPTEELPAKCDSSRSAEALEVSAHFVWGLPFGRRVHCPVSTGGFEDVRLGRSRVFFGSILSPASGMGPA